MERAGLRSVVREPAYPRLLAAATLARAATEMLPVALVLLVLERTGDAVLAGACVAALTFPSIVSGPVLGAWLDRPGWAPWLLRADQALTASCLVAIALLAGSGADGALLALAALAGLGMPLSTAGFTTMIPTVVRPPARDAANALEAASYNSALVAGPLLAGAIAAGAGPEAATLVAATIKACVLVLIAGLPARADVVAPAGPVGRSVRAGLRAIATTPALLSVTVAGTLGMAGRGLLTVAFPLFAVSQGASRAAAGLLWGALALGSIGGALGLARAAGARPPELVLVASLGAGGALMALWPLAGTFAVAVALVAAAGVALGPGLAATFSVRQAQAPRDLQGQVFLTAASLKIAAFALGSALSAPAALALGPRGALGVAAAVHVGASAAGAGLLRAGLGAAAGRGATPRG